MLRAWRATDYVVDTVLLRVGRCSSAMDALLTRAGARTGVFVTAWNPLSRAMPSGWNRRMQRRLGERLRRHVTLPAAGSLRRWHEAHLLVAADPRPVLRLARLFRQRGVVLVARHQAVRLVLLCRSDAGSRTATCSQPSRVPPRHGRAVRHAPHGDV
ncbi:MAG TPA: DUF3293 domain-containing protein [Acetobacteraceae bacterium]|nr:DUF3293 domain-containing protein [Acetobacteraceae bacterium]